MITTANGHTVMSGTVNLPRTGVWHADLVVDTQTPGDVAGAVSLSLLDDQLVLAGTATRAPGLWRGLTHVRIAAGRAGLGTLLGPQSYRETPARVILADILAGAGERVAQSSSASLLAIELASWTRLAQSAKAALRMLVDNLGATWRALPDGMIWVGTETWPASGLVDADIVGSAPEDARTKYVTATPMLRPGTTLAGAHVDRVTYHLKGDAVRVEALTT